MTRRIVILMVSVGLCASIAQADIIANGNVSPANPAAWTSSTIVYIGGFGVGGLTVDNNNVDMNLLSLYSYVGSGSTATGVVTVSGVGATWTSTEPFIGFDGKGTLNISSGGAVSNAIGHIGARTDSTGAVTVSGNGTTWANSSKLYVGDNGVGTLYIEDDGLVGVAGGLTIDSNGGDDSFIKMATGGMLALYGEADNSLSAFLLLVGGTDAIRYWDDSIWAWADITGAIEGVDYTLNYVTGTGGELDGYTVLTVNTVPEPASMAVLALGGLAVLRRRSRQAK